MITIFSNPRPFTGPFDTIQRNAIGSWLKLGCEIILFDDEEETTSRVASELGVKCLKPVCNEYGTPLLDHEFAAVKAAAVNPVLAHVNADIILFPEFTLAITRIYALLRGGNFFMIGRRWDLDVTEPLDFSGDWQEKVRSSLAAGGKLHGISGIDYWVFPKDTPFDPPSFNVGRPGMDSWLVYKARLLKIPVIDATEAITIVHQNHNYPRKAMPYFEWEVEQNFSMADSLMWGMTLYDSDRVFSAEGDLKTPPFPRNIFSSLSLFYPWRLILALKRRLRG